MKREHKYLIAGGLGVALLAGTAAGGYYLAHSQTPPVQQARVVHYQQASNQSVQPARQPCDDNNIVGTVAGGAAGGLVGSRFGSGSGKTAATVGGVVGGAMLGNAYIPTRGVTCN
jgi:uncharacterized protein YcfJ